MKTAILELKPTFYRLVRFSMGGGLATAAHWATMAALIHVGLNALWATASGAVTGAVINYGLQRRMTFRCTHPHGRTLWLYLNACIASWLANIGLFAVLLQVPGFDVATAQVLTTALVTGMNYVLYERVVFHD